MEKCRNCGSRIFFGAVKSELGNFCSAACRDGFLTMLNGFCTQCQEQTTAESTGNLKMINGIGTMLGPFSKDKCPTCGSVVKTKWFSFVVPLVPLDKYRVLYVHQKGTLGGSRSRFLARKLRPFVSPATVGAQPASSMGQSQ